MNHGKLALSRRFFEHPFWRERRIFSKAEAWIDLIAEAAFCDHRVIVGIRQIEIKRGEVPHSIRYLAARWGWSKGKTERFIECLKTETMIERKTRQGVSILSVVKYNDYQNQPKQGGTTAGQQRRQQRDNSGTTAGQTEVREVREYNNTTTTNTRKRVSGGGDGKINPARIRAAFPELTERGIHDAALTAELSARNGDAALWLAALADACADAAVRAPVAVAGHRMRSGVSPALLSKARRVLGVTTPATPRTFSCENCGRLKGIRSGGHPGQCPGCGGRMHAVEEVADA